MMETDTIASALAQIEGVAAVTRGWPKQNTKLPCIAAQLKERSVIDTRDNEAYLTKTVYLLRVFAQTLGGCDALRDDIESTMAALGFTLEDQQEANKETAQLQLTYEKLD